MLLKRQSGRVCGKTLETYIKTQWEKYNMTRYIICFKRVKKRNVLICTKCASNLRGQIFSNTWICSYSLKWPLRRI